MKSSFNEIKDSCKEWVLFGSLAAAKCESAPQKYLACVMTIKAFHLKLTRNHSIPTRSLVARGNDCEAKVLVDDIHSCMSSKVKKEVYTRVQSVVCLLFYLTVIFLCQLLQF